MPCFVAGILLCGSVARAQSVAFINPGKSDEIYWMTATQGMQAAAHSLGMTFEVQYAQREPLKTFEIAREMVARARRQAARLYRDHGRLCRGRPAAEDHRCRRREDVSRLQLDPGRPACRHRLAPRQVQRLARLAGTAGGGCRLSDGARADQARHKREKAFGADRKLHMLAIAGDRSTPSSIKRNQGMRRAVAENPAVVLDQEVYAAWTREKAGEQADWLYQRYPDARLVWAGNDLMAFGAMAAWEKRGGKPGADAWFSGINTSTEALDGDQIGTPDLARRRPLHHRRVGGGDDLRLPSRPRLRRRRARAGTGDVRRVHAAACGPLPRAVQPRLRQRGLRPLQQGEEPAAPALRLRLRATAGEPCPQIEPQYRSKYCFLARSYPKSLQLFGTMLQRPPYRNRIQPA